MRLPGEVAVVGAGSVGTAIVDACLIRGSARRLALYDVNGTKASAEVLDLNHGLQNRLHAAAGLERTGPRRAGHRGAGPDRGRGDRVGAGHHPRQGATNYAIGLSDSEAAGLRESAETVRTVCRDLGL